MAGTPRGYRPVTADEEANSPVGIMDILDGVARAGGLTFIFRGANLSGVRGCDTSGRLVGCVPSVLGGLEWRAVHGHTGLTGEQ